MSRLVGLTIGLALGMGAALLTEFASPHPLLLALGALVLVAIVAARVQRDMASFERGHDARAEAFRLAMLAEHAPHLLAAQRPAR